MDGYRRRHTRGEGSSMSNQNLRILPPILRNKHPRAASTFTPQNLLREARRQKGIPDTRVPEVDRKSVV